MLSVGLAHNQRRVRFENFTGSPNSQRTRNVVPIPKRRHKTRTVIQGNNQSGNPKPKLKRTRTRRPSPKKNNRHKTHTKHIQPNRKRKSNRQTTNRNKTTHKIDAHQVLKRQLILKAPIQITAPPSKNNFTNKKPKQKT